MVVFLSDGSNSRLLSCQIWRCDDDVWRAVRQRGFRSQGAVRLWGHNMDRGQEANDGSSLSFVFG